MNLRTILLFSSLVILPIAAGTGIYVGWRSTTLLVFDWMAIFGIPADIFRPTIDLPQSLLYSLPDGCWVFAGTSWMLLIWRRLHPWVFIFALLAIGGEFGQTIGFVPGTFEWNDIAFYVGGFFFACIGHKYAQPLLINNRTVGYGHTCCG